MRGMDETSIVVSRQDGVARIVLSDERRRNPLGLAVLSRLHETCAELAEDRAVSVVVLTHVGPAFSAGHDLKEMAGAEPGFLDELFARCTDVMLGLHRMPQPVIARVDGLATAAGCQLVASCDLVVASDRATFATPGVKIGLFCSTPMVALSRAIGRKRSLQMLLTGTPISAATAADWGLVNIVTAAGDLDGAVDDLAATLLRNSPHTVAIGKAAFYRQIELDEAGAYGYATEVMARNAADAVAAEGIGAFLAKREPVWPESS